jgi:CHAD domain-containing protein
LTTSLENATVGAVEPPTTHDTELEWQLDAQDLRPITRWIEAAAADGSDSVAIAGSHIVNHVDTYLDTKDRRLDRAGFSVRVRRSRRRTPEATLKSLSRADDDPTGPRIRLELEEPLDDGDSAAVKRAPGPVGQRVRALAGPDQLVPLFDVQTRRRVFPLSAAGEPSGELVLDETTFREPGGRILSRLRRVELEAPEQARVAVEPLVERLRIACGLQPAVLTKYESGLLASGIPRTAPESFGRTTIVATDTIGEVGLAVLRRQFAAFLAKEPGTRIGDDIEELHGMRVASRRLRAALALFAEVLPAGAVRLRPELAWIGQTIGAVRDLDVQLAQLDGWIADLPEPDREPLARLRLLLTEDRGLARAEMLAALDSPRYARFVRQFASVVRSRTGSRTPAALEAAPDLVGQRQRVVLKAARRIDPESPATDYHRLRIAGKRLRYALEFLADVYPGATQELVKRTIALQDLLGAHQDADVAIARLRLLAAERGVELGPQTVFAMGEIAERYQQAMAEARRSADGLVAKVGGKEWKKLRRLMEDARPVDAHPAAPR